MITASAKAQRCLSTVRDLGAGLIEYCMLIALIALVCVSAITFFGGRSGASVNHSKDCIVAAQEGQPLPPSGCP